MKWVENVLVWVVYKIFGGKEKSVPVTYHSPEGGKPKIKLTAYGKEEFPVNHQLREARIGLIGVRNYIVGRENRGDPLFDQDLVDMKEISARMLHDLDELEEALELVDSTRDEVNKLLITRMKLERIGKIGTEASDNQKY